MDIANLQIKVTETGLKSANTELDRLDDNARKAANEVDNLGKSTQNTSGAGTRLASVLRGGVGAAVAGLVSGFSAYKALQIADEFTALEGRVRNATRSIQEAEEAFDGLIDISERTGASLQASVSVFQRLSFVRDEISATKDEMLQFTDTVSKLGVLSGASNSALTAGLTQLGQSLSSSIVRAEEFNSIMENIPAVGQKIADQFGVTTGQLRQLVIEGEVLSEDVFAAIINSAQEANEEFEKYPLTIGRASDMVAAKLGGIISQINEATGATDFFAQSILKVGNFIAIVGNQVVAMIKIFDALFTSLVAGIIEAFNFALEGIEKVINFAIRGINKIKANDIEEVKLGLDLDIRGEAIPEIANDIKGAMEALQASGDEFGELFGIGRQANDNAPNATREIAKDYAALAENLKDTKDATKAAKKEMAEMEKVADKLGKTISGAFEDAIVGAKSFKDAFKDVIDSLQRTLINQLVTKPLEGVVTNAIGGIFGTGAPTAGASASTLGSIMSSVGTFFGFADGGEFQVGAGQPRINAGRDTRLVQFAARDGETVRVSTPGQRSGGSSNQIVYNIDARGADAGVEQRLLAALKSVDRSIERRALNAVDNNLKRNPTYGRR